MKKRFVIAFVAAALLGTVMHFVYGWFPHPLVGLIAPVNESVWEHLKLLFWPFLLAAIALSAGAEKPVRSWNGFLISLLVQPFVLTGAYYLLRDGFGVSSLTVDILLYCAVMALGFWLAYRLRDSAHAERTVGLLIVLAAIYGVCLIVFTLAAPNLPIFTSHAVFFVKKY